MSDSNDKTRPEAANAALDSQPPLVDVAVPVEHAPAELTPRQQQILELLKAGKVNKEIASELGIGVGTVKQHVVALFKRLHVKNRAMAVSRGMGTHAPSAAETVAVDGVLERRPCVVLSVALPVAAASATVRRLHGLLAALAFDHDAIFLARKSHAGDMIFGIQRVSEFDLLKALQTAAAVFAELSGCDPAMAPQLRGGLTAGLALASMLRAGGWSGEAIASAAIAAARERQERAPAGHLLLDRPARGLMQDLGLRANGAGEGAELPEQFLFSRLGEIRWSGQRAASPLFGRAEELGRLRAAFAAARERRQGRLLFLEGESGMGKSRLCREIAAWAEAAGSPAASYRCQPDLSEGWRIMRDDCPVSSDALAGELLAPPAAWPATVIVDDFHLLAPDSRRPLLQAARQAAGSGKLVILAGRRLPERESERAPAETIALRRLAAEDIAQLVRAVLGGAAADGRQEPKVSAIVSHAAGVPLFAVELARHFAETGIALSLLVIICARLDGLCLDRRLLRAVAQRSMPPTPAELAASFAEDLATTRQAAAQAVASGVLFEGPEGRLSFGHPLLRQVINHLAQE